jgi:uncharacterized protein with ATP-grasp and redox domains
MNALAECIPCLLRLALTTARVAGCDEPGRMKAVKIALELLGRTDLNRPPPMIAADFLPQVNKALGLEDPFLQIKHDSNQAAEKICKRWAEPYLELAEDERDRLMRAIRISIAGNIIDFAIVDEVSWEDRIPELLKAEFSILDLEALEQALLRSGSILFLADNAGEIVFDRYLLREFLNREKKIKVAVKAGPALNDALLADARMAGLNRMPGIELITTGTAKMGIDLACSSPEFQESFSGADLIVSKGQANFECLGELGGNIFFLTLIKCRALAEPLGISEGHAILVRGRKTDEEYQNLVLSR